MKNFMGVMVSHGTLQGLQDEERDCHETLPGYRMNFMGVMVSRGTLQGLQDEERDCHGTLQGLQD